MYCIFVSFIFMPCHLVRFAVRESGVTLTLPQRVRAESGRQIHLGAFWAENQGIWWQKLYWFSSWEPTNQDSC